MIRARIEELVRELRNRASDQATVQAVTLRQCADRLTQILAEEEGGWRPIEEIAQDQSVWRFQLGDHEGFVRATAPAEADEGAVRKADEIFDDITRGGPTVDAVMREDWATVAEWMRQRAEDGLAVTRAALAALPRPADLEREERAHGVTIDQRDAAESALSEAYLVVTGQPPEWSNRFGYREALDDIRGALPRPSVVIVTDEMVDVAIDRWAGFREWRDTVCAGSRRLEMRAAIEAALTATCPVVPDCCPVCGGDCGSANPPVMDCPMRPERGGALPRPAVDEGAVERATLAAYDAFFEGQIGCCEPSWDELPDSHKDRMRRSIRAALAAAQEDGR